MTDYWDVGSFKETKSGKQFFVRLGSARQNDDGGFQIYMDALPLQNSAGQCTIVVKPPRDRGNAGGNFDGPSHAERGPRRDAPAPIKKDDFNDEIPW